MLEQIDLKAKRMTKEEYKPLHDDLIARLVVLQQQARLRGVGLVVLVEGWRGAGKGSRISDLMYELDARATSVHVTQDVDPKDIKQFPGRRNGVRGYEPLMQEFWQALGERGTITFFDRGWYSAAADKALFGASGVDRKSLKKLAKKMRSLPRAEAGAAKARDELRGNRVSAYQHIAHNFEQMLVDDGYVVVKLFVHVSKKAQRKRLDALRSDPKTAWRVPESKLVYAEHYDEAYELYDEFLEGSNFSFAPWTIVNGEDRRAANVQIAAALVEALEDALATGPNRGGAGRGARGRARDRAERG